MLKTPATTSSRQVTLDRLRGCSISPPELPIIDPSRLTRYEDPIEKFCEILRFVGGEPHLVDSAEQIGEVLSAIDVFADAKQVVSLVPEFVTGTVDPSSIDDPHSLASVDWTIARGDFLVAENATIWIDCAAMPHRVLLFIAQYLAIVVSRSDVVHNMHEGYARIRRPPSRFGVFVSGPSKTADIEQSLVLGAHGCRTLQVFLTP